MSGGIFEFAALNCSQSVFAIDIALLGGVSGESVGAGEGGGGGGQVKEEAMIDKRSS